MRFWEGLWQWTAAAAVINLSSWQDVGLSALWLVWPGMRQASINHTGYSNHRFYSAQHEETRLHIAQYPSCQLDFYCMHNLECCSYTTMSDRLGRVQEAKIRAVPGSLYRHVACCATWNLAHNSQTAPSPSTAPCTGRNFCPCDTGCAMVALPCCLLHVLGALC